MKGKIQCLEIIAGAKAGDERSCFLASLCMQIIYLFLLYNAISIFSRLSSSCGGHGRNGEGLCCADILRVALFLSR